MEYMTEFGCRRGLLIDFDYSGDLGSFEARVDPPNCMFFLLASSLLFVLLIFIQGTMPFMAIALLQGKTGHTVSYDLESLSTSYWPYLSFSGHSVTLTRIMDWL